MKKSIGTSWARNKRELMFIQWTANLVSTKGTAGDMGLFIQNQAILRKLSRIEEWLADIKSKQM